MEIFNPTNADISLDGVSLDVPSGCMVGLIGPDGVGKSSLLSLLSGATEIQQGEVHVLGGDMADENHPDRHSFRKCLDTAMPRMEIVALDESYVVEVVLRL